MVPDSCKEIQLTDCVVPERKISGKDSISPTPAETISSASLDSDTNDLGQITPLLYSYLPTSHRGIPCTLPETALLPAYNLHSGAHSNSSSREPVLYEVGLSSTDSFNTCRRYRDSNSTPPIHSPRLAQSTEHLNLLSHVISTSGTSQTQRQRRNSSGSELRMRRHSAAPFRTLSLAPHSQRQRRRSHDVRDEQVDLLERLRIAATRRSFSSPFQSSNTSSRIFK